MFDRAVMMAAHFGDVPEESRGYDARRMRFLVRICYQLQRLTQPEPFPISWNEVAETLDISPSYAGQCLRMLAEDGIIAPVETPNETLATKYKYVYTTDTD